VAAVWFFTGYFSRPQIWLTPWGALEGMLLALTPEKDPLLSVLMV
jgi:hypothetical protein